MNNANVSDKYLEKIKPENIPDVVRYELLN